MFRDSNRIQHLSAITLKMNAKKVCRYRIAPRGGLVVPFSGVKPGSMKSVPTVRRADAAA